MYKTLPINKKDKNPSKSRRVLTFGLAGLAFFVIGMFVGNGKIAIGNSMNLAKSSTNTQLPENLDLTSVQALYDALKRSYDGELKPEQLLDGIKKGMVEASGDKYTEYFNAKDAKDFSDSLNGTFSGIGAELSKENNAITVVAPISGSPADNAGMRPQDIIVGINEESAVDWSVNDAVEKIRGPEGTKVKLKVIRNKSQELNFEITRQKITVPSVEHSVTADNIGYVKISRFGDDTAQLTKKAAEEFKTKNVKGVIVDLRGDPGGLLDAAVDVSSLWLDKGKLILQEKRGGEVVKSFDAKGGNILVGIPTVVLIDEGSASASEIMAGALKDNKAATLIGVKSYGKGSVQQLSELRAGGVLKVTVARWYTPAGKNIDKEGIQPDKKVERTEDDYKNKKDPQKDAAIEYLNKD